MRAFHNFSNLVKETTPVPGNQLICFRITENSEMEFVTSEYLIVPALHAILYFILLFIINITLKLISNHGPHF